MSVAYYSARLTAGIDRVWAIVGDFHGVGEWISVLQTCVARGDRASEQVGAIREFTVRSGATLQEQLVAYDSVDHCYSYEFVGTIPYPVSSFRGTAHLLPIVEDGTTFIEWFGEFEAEPDVLDDVRNQLEKLYAGFIADLRRHLAAR
jgi:hypothetical protein